MRPSLRLPIRLLHLLFLLLNSVPATRSRALAEPCPRCLAHGVDFQSGGTYFQNGQSTDPFDFRTAWTGCQADTAYNILVNTTANDGAEYQCTSTPLTPDNATRLSTCPITKNHLTSGTWALLLLSNNGDCAPVAYERDITLLVGTQATTTIIPTVTVSSTFTAIRTRTATLHVTRTMQGRALFTLTSPSQYFQSTVTSTPTLGALVTAALFTQTITHVHTVVHSSVSVVSRPCEYVPDPTATLWPSLAAGLHLSGLLQSSRDGRRGEEKSSRDGRDGREEARQKRDIDPQTLSITLTDPSLFTTQTRLIHAPTPLLTTTVLVKTHTQTTQPLFTTVYEGINTPAVTLTAAPITSTATRVVLVQFVHVQTTLTKTDVVLVTTSGEGGMCTGMSSVY